MTGMRPDMTPEERQAERDRCAAEYAERLKRAEAHAAAHPVSAEDRALIERATRGLFG